MRVCVSACVRESCARVGVEAVCRGVVCVVL